MFIIQDKNGKRVSPLYERMGDAENALKWFDDSHTIFDVMEAALAAQLNLKIDNDLRFVAGLFGLSCRDYLFFLYSQRKGHKWSKLSRKTRVAAWANRVDWKAVAKELAETQATSRREWSNFILRYFSGETK